MAPSQARWPDPSYAVVATSSRSGSETNQRAQREAFVIRVKPLTPTIGAEIEGVDLRSPLDRDEVHAIRQALLDHLLIVFREQELTNEELLRFGATFGPVTPSAFQTAFSDRPDLMVLDQTTPKGEGSDQWHADHTFFEVPPMGLVLRAVQLPSTGGDTCF